MSFPIELNFQHMEEKPEFRKMLLHEVRKLERRFDGIRHCHVVMDLPYHHRYQGNPYRLKVEVGLPRGDIIVDRAPSADGRFTDGLAMIRDAFAEISQNLGDPISGLLMVSATKTILLRRSM